MMKLNKKVLFFLLIISILLFIWYKISLGSFENAWNVSDRQKLNNLLKVIDATFNENNIDYFAAYGTSLGIERHQGIIPWDDDVDIGIHYDELNKFINIIKKLKDKGYNVVKINDDFYKIFPRDGYKWNSRLINPFSPNTKWPFVDVFIFKQEKQNNIDVLYTDALDDVERIKKSDIFPTSYYKFDDLYVKGVKNLANFNRELYGDDRLKYAYANEYNHKYEMCNIPEFFLKTKRRWPFY